MTDYTSSPHYDELVESFLVFTGDQETIDQSTQNTERPTTQNPTNGAGTPGTDTPYDASRGTPASAPSGTSYGISEPTSETLLYTPTDTLPREIPPVQPPAPRGCHYACNYQQQQPTGLSSYPHPPYYAQQPHTLPPYSVPYPGQPYPATPYPTPTPYAAPYYPSYSTPLYSSPSYPGPSYPPPTRSSPPSYPPTPSYYPPSYPSPSYPAAHSPPPPGPAPTHPSSYPATHSSLAHSTPAYRATPSYRRTLSSSNPINKIKGNKANVTRRRNFFWCVMMLCSKSDETGISFRRGRFMVLDKRNSTCFDIYNKCRRIMENASCIVKNEYFREHFCFARGCLDRVDSVNEVYEPMIEDQEVLEHLMEYSKSFTTKMNQNMGVLSQLGIRVLEDDFTTSWKECQLRGKRPKKERHSTTQK